MISATTVEGRNGTYTTPKGFASAHKYSYRPPPEARLQYHSVKKGETWQDIARIHHISVPSLIKFVFPPAVRPDGRVDERIVNQWLFNHADYRSPRAPDGVNAMFRTGQLVPVPRPGVMPQRPTAQGGSTPNFIGEELLCWAALKICGKVPVAAEPALWSRSIKDEHGRDYKYKVFKPAQGRGRIVIFDANDQEVRILRPNDDLPSVVSPKLDQLVLQALGMSMAPGPPTVRERAGKSWARTQEFFGTESGILRNLSAPGNVFFMWLDPTRAWTPDFLDKEYKQMNDYIREEESRPAPPAGETPWGRG